MGALATKAFMELVIGNGLIGKALYYHLRRFTDVQITSRREIDLERPDEWCIPKCEKAYICAGRSLTQDCEENPEETRRVNVDNTVLLAERLDCYTIWISSERVFDGTVPYRKISDKVSPTTEYGRQKVEAERRLLDIRTTVIRFAKVLGYEVSLLDGWIEKLRKEEYIHPYSNIAMSPISVSLAVETLRKMGNERLKGLYQLSAPNDLIYSDIARHIANYMGLSHLVLPVPSPKPHPYTTLETNLVNTDVPNAWEVVNEYCRTKSIL